MEKNLKERVERNLKNAQRGIELNRQSIQKIAQNYPDESYIYGIQNRLKDIIEYLKEVETLQDILDRFNAEEENKGE